MPKSPRFLIIRFSAIGDVVQTLSLASAIKSEFPLAQVDFVTKANVAPLLAEHPHIDRVFALGNQAEFHTLKQLIAALKQHSYSHIYDVHNNLRSRLVCWGVMGFLCWRAWFKRIHFIRRSLHRGRRFLLFTFRINLFDKPFAQQKSLLKPLRPWGICEQLPPPPQLFLKPSELTHWRTRLPDDFIALAPGASYKLKKWPKDYWSKLIERHPDLQFVIVGGPEDKKLAQDLVISERVHALAGDLSLRESAAVIALARLLISNDTGLMHMAEQLGTRCFALMGPAPFGYPSRLEQTSTFEIDLWCRPCSKHGQGPCINPNYQQCLRDISPETVSKKLSEVLKP